MKCFAKGVLGALIVLILAAIAIPQYSDYTDRAITNQVLYSVESIKSSIEKQLLINQPVKLNTNTLSLENVKSININVKGVITIKAGKIGQLIILTPELIDDKLVNWKCVGAPDYAMPPNCRNV